MLVVADVVALLKSEKMPELDQFSCRHEDDQILEWSYKHSENKNVFDHFPHMQLFA